MPVVLARIDERLIHGQVAGAWLRRYPIDTVVVVDDVSAGDPMRQMLLEMAVSGSVKCVVTSVADAPAKLEKLARKNVFVVASSPAAVLSLLRAGVKIPDVNVGGIYAKEGRTQYFRTVFLTDQEKADVIALGDFDGVEVEQRTVPQDDKVDIVAALKRA